MYDEERIVSGDSFEGEDLNEQSLRPQTFDQYIGQKLLKDEISVYIQAAKQRQPARRPANRQARIATTKNTTPAMRVTLASI